MIEENNSNYSHLRIEFNSDCNLNCLYCRSNSGAQYKNINGTLSKNHIFKILDEAEELGFEIIVLTGGGEPFLRSDLFDIIEYGNLPKVILTNGTLLTEETVKKLSKLNLLSYIKISFDGFTAQPNLRGANTLNKILSSIELLEKYDIPYAINTVLTENSLHDLNELYDYIASSKAFSWGIYPLISQGRASNNIIKSADIYEVAKTIAPIINRYINDNCPFYFEVEDLFVPELLKDDWSDTTLIANKINHPCDYQLSAVTIRLNGDVSQCSRLQQHFGNIYNSSLKDILLGIPRKDYLNNKISDCEKCSNCEYIPICQGGCLGRKQLLGIDKTSPDYVACEYAKAFATYIIPILPSYVKENFQNNHNIKFN